MEPTSHTYRLTQLPDRWRRKISRRKGCWTWGGSLNNRGYGQVRHEGRTQSLHRVVYQMLVGPIPEGLQIDHLCFNRACYRPDHLDVVTAGENQRRAIERFEAERRRRRPQDYWAPPFGVGTSLGTTWPQNGSQRAA